MYLHLLILLGGLVLIVKGGDSFVAAAIRLAEHLRMPRLVIGTTLVSLATTMPEIVVSVVAGLEDEAGLAVGNAIGSCMCNLGLILGVTAVIRRVDVHVPTLRVALFTMFGLAVLLFVMTRDLALVRWQGAVLLLAGVGYFAWDFWQHWRKRSSQPLMEATDARELELESATASGAWLRTTGGIVAQFLLSAALLIIGSRLLVAGAVGVATSLGVSSIIIGLTIVAVGTSIPELVTAITSSRKAAGDLAVGNVLGANIANLSLVVGAAAAVSDVRMDRLTQLFSFPALLVLMALFVAMLLTYRRVSPREGAVLIALYVLYIGVVAAIVAASSAA
ncbi:MAG: calcium/sodium antiporter [Gammaproteobacteria bacterium]|nr:hypothetical protein [Gammaproteobacteria bacterium]